MALLVRKLFSALSFKIGLVLILSWLYWADPSFSLLMMGLCFLLLGIIGFVTTIVKEQEESD